MIPLRVPPPQQRNANGNVLQALPRSDTQSELEYVDSLQTLPEGVQNLLTQNKDQNIVVDGDKVIINGHIVHSNVPTTIVDVLNRKEQGHLFGKDDGGPMAIQILAGTPNYVPKQVRVPGKPLDPKEVTMIGSLEDELPPPPPGSNQRPKRPPPRPKRPPPPRQPPKRPPPPKKRPDNRPVQHGPRGARPPPPRGRYSPNDGRRPPGPQLNDLEDSKNEFSIQNEIVVTAPPSSGRPQNGIPQSPVKGYQGRPPPPRNRPPPPPRRPGQQQQRPQNGQHHGHGQQNGQHPPRNQQSRPQRPQDVIVHQTYQQQNVQKPPPPPPKGYPQQPNNAANNPQPSSNNGYQSASGQKPNGYQPTSGQNPPSGYQPNGGQKPPTGYQPNNAQAPTNGYQPSTGQKPPSGYQPNNAQAPTNGYQPSTGQKPPSGYQPNNAQAPPNGYQPINNQNPSQSYQSLNNLPPKSQPSNPYQPPNQQSTVPKLPPVQYGNQIVVKDEKAPARPSQSSNNGVSPSSSSQQQRPQKVSTPQQQNRPYSSSGGSQGSPVPPPSRPSAFPPTSLDTTSANGRPQNRPPYVPPNTNQNRYTPPQTNQNRPPYQPPTSGSFGANNQQPPANEDAPSRQPQRIPPRQPPVPQRQPPQSANEVQTPPRRPLNGRPSRPVATAPPRSQTQPIRPQTPPPRPQTPPARPQTPAPRPQTPGRPQRPQRPQRPVTQPPRSRPSTSPNVPPFSEFGQKLPNEVGYTPSSNYGEVDNVISEPQLLNERDYTPIDKPSRDPAYPRPTPASGNKGPGYKIGNRYQINGNKRPYVDNSPSSLENKNKERRPLPVATGNQIISGSQNEGGRKDLVQDLTITNSRGQYQVIQTAGYDAERPQIDPSFVVGAGYVNTNLGQASRTPPGYVDKTVAVGAPAATLLRGSVEDGGSGLGGLEDGSTSIDYQGWYTQGDSIAPLKPFTSTSRQVFVK